MKIIKIPASKFPIIESINMIEDNQFGTQLERNEKQLYWKGDDIPPPTNGDMSIIMYLNARDEVSDEKKNEIGAIIRNDIELVWGCQVYDKNGSNIAFNVSVDIRWDFPSQPLNNNEFYFDIETDNTVAGRSFVEYTGAKSGVFYERDLLSTPHTPSHEFGHMLGLEDRYHYAQNTRRAMQAELGSFPKIGYNPYFVKPYDNASDSRKTRFTRPSSEPSRNLFSFAPMLLPKQYDEQYDCFNNLYSTTSDELTDLQKKIALYNYANPDNKILEVIPVYQFTFFSSLLINRDISRQHWALGLSKTQATRPEDVEFVLKSDKMTKETNVIVYRITPSGRRNFNVDHRIADWMNPTPGILTGSKNWDKNLWDPRIRTAINNAYLNRWMIKLPYMLPTTELDLDGLH